jgi:N-acetylmuramoyl-L-alanine amidase
MKNMNKASFHILLICIFFMPIVLLAKEKTFTVVIDAGHGGHDPGAKGAIVDEKVVNLSVALKLGNLISERMEDVKVVYTRKTDRFIELDERAAIANNNKANLFISIHANSLDLKRNKKNRLITGAETYTMGLANSDESMEVARRENSVILLEENYLQKYEGFDNSAESYIMISSMNQQHMEQSIRFASEIQQSFIKAKRNDRGVRQASFVVLRRISMPGVLVELGFLSNIEEERYLKSKDGQNTMVQALYNAFSVYKLEYEKNKSVTVPPASSVQKPQPAARASAQSPKEEKVYRIQILASKAKIKPNSKQLKGYKNVDVIEGNGYYRYMYGKSSDLKAMQELHKKVTKDFKDAFIVAFTTDTNNDKQEKQNR